MHRLGPEYATTEKPALLDRASQLVDYLRSLSPQQLAVVMKINDKLAQAVSDQFATWNQEVADQRSAIHSFAGDIYSGLQVHAWSASDMTYAQQHLRILSGLYGVLKPLDGIMPYRLELGYRLPAATYRNLYDFWGTRPLQMLPSESVVVDLAAKEYSKLVLPHIKAAQVITPQFLTMSPKTGQPTFVVVHAKVARGAFAAWLIQQRITSEDELAGFNSLGYQYDAALSQPNQPTFVCKRFKGLGLSVRLQHEDNT